MGLALLFKILGRLAIPLAIAVPLNYLACIACGLWSNPMLNPRQDILESPWLMLSMAQGLFFYISFSLLALASQRIGVAMAALFSRLAIAVPVLISLVFLGDVFNSAKLLGILLTLAALVLMLRHHEQPQDRARVKSRGEFLPLALSLFGFHGIQLSIMNLAQHFYLVDAKSYHTYMASSFFFAFSVSMLAFCRQYLRGKISLKPICWPAGLILGICNYTCVFNLIKALGQPGLGGSVVFPVFSIGVVGGSALAARISFKEKLAGQQWLGLAVGGLAIGLLSVG